jgi:hypothetical protein
MTLDLLTARRPYRLTLSLYGATEASYDGMTRRRGSFRRFMRGLAAAHEAGLAMRIIIVVSNRNAHEVPAMKAITSTRLAATPTTPRAHPTSTGWCSSWTRLAPSRFRMVPGRSSELKTAGSRTLTIRKRPRSSPLPRRRRRRQAAVARHHQHRGQEGTRARGPPRADRQAVRPARPHRRGPARHGLARGPQRARHRLSGKVTIVAGKHR